MSQWNGEFKFMKKRKDDDEFFSKLNDIFEQNSDALTESMDILKNNPQPDGSLFSPELKSALSPFGDMDIRDALRHPDFWRSLAKYGGMSDEKINEIMNNSNKE